MSRADVVKALKAVVLSDRHVKAAQDGDNPWLIQTLPAAGIWCESDADGALPVADARTDRYVVRLYTKSARGIGMALPDLASLAETLGTNLEAHRRLTGTAWVDSYGGGLTDVTQPNGPIVVCYDMTVTVTQKPTLDVVLSAAGGATVTLFDVATEPLPVEGRSEEWRYTVDGTPVLYTRDDGYQTVSLSGRCDSEAEGERLVNWYTLATAVSYTDRTGTLSQGWTISGSPTPRAERRDLPSDHYDVSLTLRRAS